MYSAPPPFGRGNNMYRKGVYLERRNEGFPKGRRSPMVLGILRLSGAVAGRFGGVAATTRSPQRVGSPQPMGLPRLRGSVEAPYPMGHHETMEALRIMEPPQLEADGIDDHHRGAPPTTPEPRPRKPSPSSG